MAIALQAISNENTFSATIPSIRKKANPPNKKKRSARTYTPVYLTPPGVSLTPDMNPQQLARHPLWGAVLEAFFPNIHITPFGVIINRPPLSYRGNDLRYDIKRAVVSLYSFKYRAQNEIIRAVKAALGTDIGRFSKTSAPRRGAVLRGREDLFVGVEVDGKPLWVIVPREAIKGGGKKAPDDAKPAARVSSGARVGPATREQRTRVRCCG